MEDLKHIDWDKFHFLRAEYLWWAIPLFLVIALGFLAYSEKDKWKRNIAAHLQPYVVQKGTIWKSRIVHASLLVLFALGFISFLAPTWHEVKAPAKKIESKLVIALDMSQSMLATDISPNRLERAKFKISDFLKANPRAQTALLVFAGSSHIVVPFTTDYKIIKDDIDGLKPSMMPVRGTGFRALYTKLDSLFTGNAAEGKVLLMTDDLQGLDIPQVSAFVQENNVKLYIFPFATETGGDVPSFVNAKLPLKEKGEVVRTALDTTVLRQLRSLQKVEIVDMTLDKSDVTTLAKEIKNHLVFEEKQGEKENNWQDDGYWLVIPLALFFLFCFRKGWAIYSLLLAIGLSSCAKTNKPSSHQREKLAWADLWYTKGYQGQQAYDKQDYRQAAKDFQGPLHKGVAYFKYGDYASAEKAFEQDTSKIGLYNLGLTYAKLGKLQKSRQVFEELVATDPSMKGAQNNLDKVNQVLAGSDSMNTKKVPQSEPQPKDKSIQNQSPEDLSGGGQKATKKDMEKQRLEETANTGKRIAKEMDELPPDFKSGKGKIPNNILMRKVDDDPALFLTKKFKYQIKKKKAIAEETPNPW